MTDDIELEVIIIGAGSTGLLLAQGLKQNGIKYAVYEREGSSTYQTRPREWGMTLHWGQEYISKCIPPDLLPLLNEGICCDPFFQGVVTDLPNYNGKTGKKLFNMPVSEPPRRVSRRKLREFLSQGLVINYGKKLSSISSGLNQCVVATFEDDTSAAGSLIIGCDGSKSVVREILVGKEMAAAEELDINMFNVSCAFSTETANLHRAAHPVFNCAFHPANTCWFSAIQDVKDPDRPDNWLIQNIFSWKGAPRPEDLPDQASRMRWWKSNAEGFAEPWRTVGKELPEDLRLSVDRSTVWRPTMDWSKTEFGRRVTLAGDSAHCMPPFRGQGLNIALEDAANLVDELKLIKNREKTLEQAIEAYEKEMKERCLQEIPISVRTAQMSLDWEGLINTPAIKFGMNKYKEQQASRHEDIELAA